LRAFPRFAVIRRHFHSCPARGQIPSITTHLLRIIQRAA
jgi:hypothetical protein